MSLIYGGIYLNHTSQMEAIPPVTPEDTGAVLTADPYIIAESVDIEDDGTVVIRGDIYYCPDYATVCVIEELIEHGQYELRRL